VIYACLAETIVLALEGRFEVFTIGRDTEWQKVKEIYKLGLKHGMKLAAISGVNGVFSDEDIAEVVKLARRARKTWKPGDVRSGKPARKASSAKKTAKKKPATKKKAAAKKTAVKKKAVRRKATPGKGGSRKSAVKKKAAKK
jgi:Mg-chelatase subunit ChlI